MLWRPKYHQRLAQLADGLTTAASFVLAYFVWNEVRKNFGIALPIQLDWNDLWKVLGLSAVWVIIFTRLKAYTYQRFTSLHREFSIVFKTTVMGIFVFFAAFFLFRFEYVPRTYIIIFALVNFICLATEKFILFHVIKVIRRKGKNRKKILVVGTGEKAVNFIQTISENLGWGLDVIGILTKKKKEIGRKLQGKEILGMFSDIVEVLHKKIIDEVIVCVSSRDLSAAKKVLDVCENEGVQVRLNSDFFGYLAKGVAFDYVYNIPIVSFYTFQHDEWALYIKRLMDISITAILSILLSPLFLIIAALIKLTSRGPVFFEWNVVGLNKKPFKSKKFRTMVTNADELKKKLLHLNEMNGPVFKIKHDPRITKVGRFLRKYSLDELPQLWSVLKGDMSLVGPRPAFPHELHRFASWHRRKLSIKPGITCLWQIKGRSKINDFDEWAKLDLEYIDNWSLWLDLKILLMTIPAVFSGRGAS